MATVRLVNVNKVYDGGVHAVHDFSIDIADKEFIVFVGPSGCGKSTTLRMIAGLEEISFGDLLIDGKLMNAAAPKDRDIAMVFQSYALYPQMTVYKNMAYALKLRKVPKDEIDKRVREAAKILKLTPYLDRKPRALSGGQRQRVALGRSIVRRPKVFLMDEPLSNLDAKLRVAMRSEIVRIHEEVGATTIYVTHDQIEAMTMASRIVVMKDGFIQQIGEPNELYRNPANMFVAGFIGTPAMNFLHGTLENGYFIIDGTGEKIKLTPDQKKLLKNYEGKRLVYGIRPENIVYEKSERFEKFKDTAFKMKAGMIELLGDIINVHGDVGGNRVILKMNSKYAVKERDEFTAAIDTEYSRFFNESTTKAITPDHCDYEEAELTASLDEDNVTIIEQEKQGIFAKALGAVKNKIKSAKTAKSPADTAAPADQADTADSADNNREN
ncbi:MAG: sn-glycerol-3-phosphate ABC transporter ATP-binding protein UgpC [Clostridia bacterium]|nr:sn-glycerol-3-phosphate ABC transporter ATP-binding protein UgpC [Clostridia bacterium]